jgi:hypothetical protein
MSDEIKQDPAGLDSLLMAAGKGVARWLEGAVQQKTGIPVTIWDGQDGLGAILRENLDAAGVPNKRLPELVTPRSILDTLGSHDKMKRARIRRRNRRAA